MKKSSIILLLLLFIPCLIVLLNNQGMSSTIEDNITFNPRLSDYGLYQGKMSALIPCDEATVLELASTLFTDYTDKQRIILLPKGQKMKAMGNGLPDFPEGTIMAKTFFYARSVANSVQKKYLLETRLLIKHKSQWNAATYQWDEGQHEAYLVQDGATIGVTFVDSLGTERSTNYKIPSKTDCIACHRQNKEIVPIGPKLRNMNFDVNRAGEKINQLTYFMQNGKLQSTDIATIDQAINYNATDLPLAKRARAYLDINCSHCHNPRGTAYITQLDLRQETAIHETGIWLKQGKMAHRVTVVGELHMPRLGTTIPDEAGVQLIVDYLQHLDK